MTQRHPPSTNCPKFSQSLLEFTQQHTGDGLNHKHPNDNDATSSRMKYRIHFTQPPESKTHRGDNDNDYDNEEEEYIPSTFDFMVASLYSKDPHSQAGEYKQQFIAHQQKNKASLSKKQQYLKQLSQEEMCAVDSIDDLMHDGDPAAQFNTSRMYPNDPSSPLHSGFKHHNSPIPRPVVDTFINKQYHNNSAFNQSATTALSTLQYYKLNHERYSNWFQSPLRISQIFYQFNNHMCLLSYFYNLLQFGDPLNTNKQYKPR